MAKFQVRSTAPLEFHIFCDPGTGRFGYRVRFAGADKFHHSIDTCKTPEEAVRQVDRHNQRVWEIPSSGCSDALLVSRDYKQDTDAWKMQKWRADGRSTR